MLPDAGGVDATVLLLGVVVGLGAFVQSSIGFGLAVVAAPFVVVAAPQLMPASLLVTVLGLTLIQLTTLEHDVAWRPLAWALCGRLLLTPLGVALVGWLSARAISAVVGALVLLSVAASARAPTLAASGRASFAAGAIAGVSGTAASIGGPFFALVLAGEEPRRVRSTLAVFFAVGAAIALGALAAAGQVRGPDVRAGLAWLPFVAAGLLAAGPARRRLDRERLRRGVLLFCVVASVSVLVRAALR